MTEALIFGGIVAIPFITWLCAKIAARTWYNEKRRYHHDFINTLREPN